MTTACAITRPYRRTRARTHLAQMESMGTLELTCGNTDGPPGIIGGIDGSPWNRWADLRKLPALTVKPQVTPNVPNNPTHAANNPNTFPQVNANNPNNPTHFVSTRARAYVREAPCTCFDWGADPDCPTHGWWTP